MAHPGLVSGGVPFRAGDVILDYWEKIMRKNIPIIIAALVCFLCSLSIADTVSQRQQTALEYIYYHRANKSNAIEDIMWSFSTLVLEKNQSSIITTQDINKVNSIIASFQNSYTDEYYWILPELMSMLADNELKTNLTESSVNKVKDILFSFTKENSKLADTGTNITNEWYLNSSDNHNIIRKSLYMLVSQIFKNNSEWKNYVYDDGHSPLEHYNAWNSFFKEFFKQRAIKGVQVEFGSPTYAGVYLQSVFNIYNYCEDKQQQNLAGKYLDLYYTDAAVESLNGVRGGAKTRVYKDSSSYDPYQDHLQDSVWLLTGIPDTARNRTGNFWHNICGELDTAYRLPQFILDLYLNSDKRGTFEYIVSRPGIATNYLKVTYWDTQLWFPAYLRYYSYVTPKFVLGSYTIDETKTYNVLLDQNPWMGLIAADQIESRIGITMEAYSWKPRNGNTDIYGVGNKGTLIFRRHNSVGDSRYPRLYVSATFTNFSEKTSGWIIGKNSDSSVYFALYCTDTDGGNRYTISNAPADVAGAKWIYFANRSSVGVFEVGLASKYNGLNDFETKVTNNIKQWNNSNEFEYHSLYGDTFLFYRDTTLPKLNGKTVDLNPKKTYDCPYISSKYNSSKIDIRDSKTLDFNY